MSKPTKHTFLACLLPVIHISAEGAAAVLLAQSTDAFTREGIVCLTLPLLGGMVLTLITVILLLVGNADGRRMLYGMFLNYGVSWAMIGIGCLMRYGHARAAVLVTVPVLALCFLLAVDLQYGHNRCEQAIPLLCSPLIVWLAWMIAGTATQWDWVLLNR